MTTTDAGRAGDAPSPVRPTLVADAALCAGMGDLNPAARWMRAVGAQVHQEPQQVTWTGAPGVPVGGLATGTDPVCSVIQLLLASVGLLWPLVPECAAVLEDVTARWNSMQGRERQTSERGTPR